MNKMNLYKCYSINQFFYLKQQGFYYIVKEKNERTGKNYWVFEVTPELEEALKVWTLRRQSLNK